jgi:hypothetical protein
MSQLSTALSDATDTVFAVLISNTGKIEEQSAFKGYLPDITNAFSFSLNGGNLDLFLNCNKVIDLTAVVRGRFCNYSDALSFAGEVIGSFPISDNGNVRYARAISMPIFQERWVRLHGDNKRSLHTEVTITLSVDVNIGHNRCLLGWEYSWIAASNSFSGPILVSSQQCKTYDPTIVTNVWSITRTNEEETVWASKTWFESDCGGDETAEITWYTSSSSSSSSSSS